MPQIGALGFVLDIVSFPWYAGLPQRAVSDLLTENVYGVEGLCVPSV
jgi:hypothetical protein